MDCSPPGSSVHRISQARTLEWVTNSFSRGPSWPSDRTWVSVLQADCTIWTTREAPWLQWRLLNPFRRIVGQPQRACPFQREPLQGQAAVCSHRGEVMTKNKTACSVQPRSNICNCWVGPHLWLEEENKTATRNSWSEVEKNLHKFKTMCFCVLRGNYF